MSAIVKIYGRRYRSNFVGLPLASEWNVISIMKEEIEQIMGADDFIVFSNIFEDTALGSVFVSNNWGGDVLLEKLLISICGVVNRALKQHSDSCVSVFHSYSSLVEAISGSDEDQKQKAIDFSRGIVAVAPPWIDPSDRLKILALLPTDSTTDDSDNLFTIDSNL